jgi:inner membrane protein
LEIESVSWVDEEITEKLAALLERYPGVQMYLTGQVEVEEGEEVRYLAKAQQLVTVVKRGNRVELNSSCPLGDAIGLLREQWGTGQMRVRVVD